MDTALILSLAKARLGITTAVRDTYLAAIVDGVVKELSGEQGVVLEPDNASHLMFCVDYVTWRYQSATQSQTSFTGQPLSMPRHLQFRLHNLIIHSGG